MHNWVEMMLAAQSSDLAMKLFTNKDKLLKWVQLYDCDRPWNEANLSLLADEVAPPLYYAAAVGLSIVVERLLEGGADVDAQGGLYSSALQAASACGHTKIVQMLLRKGAAVNAQGGYYGSALQAASCAGHEKIVQILLECGALSRSVVFGNEDKAEDKEDKEDEEQVL